MKKLKTKYIDLPTLRMSYSENGQGPNLILLHGNSGNKNMFRKYQTEYFSDFHTYALDSRGHGHSKSNDYPYSIEGYSEDVIAFCRSKNIEKAGVIGYSDGGNISLYLGLKAPGVFEKIIAVSPNYLVEGTTDKALRIFRRIYSIFEGLSRIGFNTANWRARFDLMLHDIGLTRKDLNLVETAIHIIYAENDMIKEDHILDIHHNIPNSTLQKIPKSTHLSIMNKKAAINASRDYLLCKRI